MSKELIFHDTPIVIDSWQRDDTYEGVYPSGARVKDAYFSPENPEDGCIKPKWRYLFKLSRSWCPWQFWGEVIAYRFGSLIGVPVPPAHIGFSKDYKQGVDTYAALIEWFYDENKDVYVSGEQTMVSHIEDFDRNRGKKHNLETIRYAFGNNQVIFNCWARILTFDTLIGNTDRHQENWGLVLKDARLNPKSRDNLYLSPAFDNGTALGYEILEDNIHKYDDTSRLERYLTNRHARHHMKWSLNQDQDIRFYEFVKKFTVEFPETMAIMAKCLDFTYQQVEDALSPLVGAVSNAEYKLTSKRLEFILKLIFGRKRILEETLGL